MNHQAVVEWTICKAYRKDQRAAGNECVDDSVVEIINQEAQTSQEIS